MRNMQYDKKHAQHAQHVQKLHTYSFYLLLIRIYQRQTLH